MKSTLPYLILLSYFFFPQSASSQISVVSNNGYTVNIVIQPVQIVTSGNSCTWGYNYNVKMNYSVTFTGNNIPSSLYTLQGTLGCGSSSHFFNLPNNGGVGTVTSQSNVWRSQSDCGTATISSLTCNIINLQIQGPGISNRTVSFAVAESPLPVKMVGFKTTPINNKVKLEWSTATEQNNDFFTVERLVNGSGWKTITTVKGAGNSSILLNYVAYDENPAKGTALYRIKQTDLDGKFTFSDTRTVKFGGVSEVSVYPVPNSGNTINFNGITDPGATKITLRNASGATVFTTQLSSNSVQLPSIASGLYFINVSNNQTGETTNLRYVQL